MTDDPAKEVEKLIADKYALAETGDYYKLLNVGKNATPVEVRRAYFALVKKVHPDRLPKLGLTKLSEQANRLFQVMTRGYEILSDAKKKAEYDKGKLKGITPSNPAQPEQGNNRGEAGKIAFHKGTVLLNKRAWERAEEYLREAVEATDDNARYWQSLGWAVFCNEDVRPEKLRLEGARECFEKALDLDDEDAMTHYNIGLYWKAKENMTRCKQAMQKALECKPNFVEAKREIRLMKMRSQSDRARGKRGASSRKKGDSSKAKGNGRDRGKKESATAWEKFVAFLTKPR